jgi:chromosome segregation ATPase
VDLAPPRATADAAASDADALAAELAARVETLASSERELRHLLTEAHEQIAGRDEEIERLRDALEYAQGERDRLWYEATTAHARLRQMTATKLWRAGTLYRRTRDAVRRRGA